MGKGLAGNGDYPRGSVVLVRFPFTDLSGRKRRTALVVSPRGFDAEDLILCAITSRVPAEPPGPRWEVLLEAGDVIDRPLPKRSVVKVGKLFTMHRRLAIARFGSVHEHKLGEVLQRLRALFSQEMGSVSAEEVILQAEQVE